MAALWRAPAGLVVPAFVAQYVGLPWLKKGRGRAGCDCYGLGCLVTLDQTGQAPPSFGEAYDAALLGPDVTRVGLRALSEIIDARLVSAWREVAFEDAEVLDWMLLPIVGEPCHIALYVGDLHILHIEEGCNAVCENLREPYWHGRLRHARLYRFVGGAQC